MSLPALLDSVPSMSVSLGIIGGGVMGEALLTRLMEKKLFNPDEILVSDPQFHKREELKQKYHIHVTGNNLEVAEFCQVLILAIKPQILDKVVPELISLNNKPLVISILAGVTLARLEEFFSAQPVIRAMPNTPATVGAAMTAITPGKLAQVQHLEQAKSIFAAVGEVVEVPEYLMDAVTGLSGSGPAYVAIMIEALADGGVAAGLPRAIANQLAMQTVLGTAQLLQESGLHPGQLKDRVTSPGGTTIAGVSELEKHGFRYGVIAAVLAAARRAQELGNN